MSQPNLSPSPTTSMSHIARAATLVMALFMVSRVLGLLREMVIAGQFGTSANMDAYLAAFRLPDLLFYMVAGGALGSAFIPVFTGYLVRDDMAGAWRLASAVINWVLLILLFLGGLAAWLAPELVRLLLPNFTPAQQMLTTELMRLMLVAAVIFGVSGVAMGILNAQQHFLLPALAPVIYNAAIILAAWFLGPTWGVRGLAVGVVAGSAAHLLVQVPGLLQRRMQYRPGLLWRDSGLHEVGRLMAPRVLGLAAVQINFMVTTVLAAGLSPGSLTALNYGWIIMLLPQGIIAQSVATALFPTLATLVARGQYAEMRRVFGTTLRNMLFLTLPAAVGLLILRVPLVRLLLEWGEFDETSTRMTAWALGFFALGLVGHAVVEISTRAFYALKNTKTPVIVAVVTMIINVGLSVALINLFSRLHWPPHGGLALANSLAVLLEVVVLLVLLRPIMGGLAQTSMRASLLKMSLAALGMAAVLLLVILFLPSGGKWVGGITGITVGGVVYGGLAYLLQADELDFLRRRITRR